MPQKTPRIHIPQKIGKAHIRVRLQPRASKDEILGWKEDGALWVRVKAPPVNGAANAALVQLLAKHLGVAKSKVALVSGTTARNKIVEVQGVPEPVLRKVLDGHQAHAK